MDLTPIIELSHHFGSDPNWVLAGGGNTSQKDAGILAVKASGHALATIDESGFVKMDRAKLAAVWKTDYPADPAEREDQALADLMSARHPEDSDKRPSVETLMHDLCPQRLVVHTHPTLVNGLTCARQGREIAEGIFGDAMVWIPVVNPGYVLAATIRDALATARARTGRPASILLMQNHGLVVADDTVAGIHEISNRILDSLNGRVDVQPRLSDTPVVAEAVASFDGAIRFAFSEEGTDATDLHLSFLAPRELGDYLADERAFEPISDLGYTPDHIVYCRRRPLFVPTEAGRPADRDLIRGLLARYREQNAGLPKIVAVQGLGVFACGTRRKAVDAAAALFVDLLKLLRYAHAFGGPVRMDEDKILFIVNWEVEQYRSQVST